MDVTGSGSRLAKPPVDGVHGTLVLELSQRDDLISAASSVASVVGDANVLDSTPATIDTAWDVTSGGTTFGRIIPVSLECIGAGSLSEGRLTRVSDGACSVIARSGMFTKRVDVTMNRSTGGAVRSWQSWVPGSLAAACQQTVDVSVPFWSGAPGGFAMGSGYGFTAISPRHVVGNEHIEWMPAVLTLGGVSRNLVDQVTIGPANGVDGYASDLRVGLYDGDFPSFARVFPSNLQSYLPNVTLRGVPAFITNQFGQKIQRRTLVFRVGLISFVKISPSDTDIIGGDSGNPGFIVINGEPILLGCLQQGGWGGVTTIHSYITEVNAAMTALGGGYQLSQIDLSGYPTYG